MAKSTAKEVSNIVTNAVLARVLSTYVHGEITAQPNNLIQGSPALIESLELAGIVDSNPAAVEYCQSEGALVITIDEPAPTEPAPTEPAPTEPAPTEPAPTEPAPTEPATTEPAPTEPADQ